MKTHTKLYNVIFPVWMLFLIPGVWLIVIPGNFIIDSVLLILSFKFLKFEKLKSNYKKCILKVFAFGLVADFIGSLFMFFMLMLEISTTAEEWYLTLPAILVAAAFIFIFDYFISFKGFEKPQRLKLSLTFAILTAPYTFLIPVSWIY